MGAHLVLPDHAARGHERGHQAAPITLVEFGDYQCRRCGAAHPIVEAIRRQCGRQLRFVFRHFPLTAVHPRAHRAAEAGEAAGAQAKFWEMHDTLFEHQEALEDDDLLLYAVEIGIDAGRCARELAERTHRLRVREDLVFGTQYGVTRTPTFFINGLRHLGGYDPESLLTTIEQICHHAGFHRRRLSYSGVNSSSRACRRGRGCLSVPHPPRQM
jgi:protein-disulfide isomerase